jgi:DNA-binding LacI/PurR family transcriptional regulator
VAGRAKIEDVARHAGVSKATVSRVLNRPELVSAATVKRVRRAMEQLEFTPNRHARALNGFRNPTVGLLFFEELRDLFVNPFWGAAAATVYESLAARGIDCSVIALGSAGYGAERFSSHSSFEQFLQTRNVDGFVLVGNVGADQEADLASMETPVAMWGRPSVPGSTLTYVDSDNLSGSTEAVRHLLGLGRRRVGLITGGPRLVASRDRRDGYLRALSDQGLPVVDTLVVDGDFTSASGRRAMAELLDADPGLDAVFASNDEMAIGALGLLRDRGMTVPDDIAIIGFDNTAAASAPDVNLTTMSHAYAEVGSALVEAVVRGMAGEKPSSRLIATSLVRRATA